MPFPFAIGDEPLLPEAVRIDEQWQLAQAMPAANEPAVLRPDDVHRITGWAESVKATWDRDAREARAMS